MKAWLPATLVFGSLLAIGVGVGAAAAHNSGTVHDTEGGAATWEVLDESGWVVKMELPQTYLDYLYDSETGDPMQFESAIAAREFALGYLKGLGFS
jgi:hypothetical protein